MQIPTGSSERARSPGGIGLIDGEKIVFEPQSFPIDKIHVPEKKRKALKPEVVEELAESILEVCKSYYAAPPPACPASRGWISKAESKRS